MKIREIINKETKFWQEAYPDESLLLKRFANKIILELELKGLKP